LLKLAFFTTAVCKPTLPFTISLPPAFRALTSKFDQSAQSSNVFTTTEITTTSQPYFKIPRIPTFAEIVEQKQAANMKNYSGIREQTDSLIMIYYHDQTIAVVELGPQKLLVGCELIEIYNDKEGKKLLEGLSTLNRPFKISFKDMIKLMTQCQTIDIQKSNGLNMRSATDSKEETQRNTATLFGGNNPLSLFKGILPGTKWCGTGDIAKTYSDLGEDIVVDRCCRTHDLCPVKIRAYQNKYSLENNSLYSKSHCVCDDMLYSCLRKSNTSSAQLMGTIYFNLVQVIHSVLLLYQTNR
jgi:hypothetical protein